MKYSMDLMKKSNPDILVATPGRLKGMIESQLFSFESLQWVIFDECDRLLNGDFDGDLNPLRAVLPRGFFLVYFIPVLIQNLFILIPTKSIVNCCTKFKYE